MPKIKLPGLPEPPKPPDPAAPFNIIRKFLSNSKNAVEQAKKGVKDLADEIKKPFDRYGS